MTSMISRRIATSVALALISLSGAAVSADRESNAFNSSAAVKAADTDSAVLLCPPGATVISKDGLGMYDSGDGLTLLPVKAGQECKLLATAAGLNVAFPGQSPLLLTGPVAYRLNLSPRRADIGLAQPALCESYYTGNDLLAVELVDTNGALQTLRGVNQIRYSTAQASFSPAFAAAAYGPYVQCYAFPAAALIANPPAVPALPPMDPDLIHSSGFDDSASLRVDILNGGGDQRVSQLDVTRDQPFDYLIRVTNVGPIAASGVRVREFVPLPATDPLLTPVVTPGAWSCQNAVGAPCDGLASGTGALNQAGLAFAPGESRIYRLTRTVSSGAPPQGTLLGAAVFFDPTAAGGFGDAAVADNSAPLVLTLVPNQGPRITCATLSGPVNLDENAAAAEFDCQLTDLEEDPISGFVVVSNSNNAVVPTAGMLTDLGNDAWRLRFEPAANALGTASILLRASDNRGGTRDLLVTVNVNDVNSAPSFELRTAEIRMSTTGGLPRDAAGVPIDNPHVVRGSNCPSLDVCTLTFPNFLIDRSLGAEPEAPTQQLQAAIACAPQSEGLNPFELAPSIAPVAAQSVSQPFALSFTYRKLNFDPPPSVGMEVVCTVTVTDTGSPALNAQRTLRIVYQPPN
jgi:hypothetical protein